MELLINASYFEKCVPGVTWSNILSYFFGETTIQFTTVFVVCLVTAMQTAQLSYLVSSDGYYSKRLLL